MRTGRILAAIRPKVAKPAVQTPPKFRIGPWGITFLLGGLAFASWLAKPSKTMPVSAMDTFKPRIAIVFVLGDSQGQAQEFANANGYKYVDALKNPQETMEPLVQQGITKFIIDHVPVDNLAEFEQNVVECDLALDFNDSAPQYLKQTNRVEKMESQTVLEALKERNLV